MPDLLTEVRNRTFQDEIVLVDDKAFNLCTLDRCELRYHGGAVTFQDTSITSCSWSFGGSAQRTISLFQFFSLDPHALQEPEHALAS